jgi:hypothetical protein
MRRYRFLRAICFSLIVLSYACSFSESSASASSSQPMRLKKAHRFERDHWIYVHLEGAPKQIGFQHG